MGILLLPFIIVFVISVLIFSIKGVVLFSKTIKDQPIDIKDFILFFFYSIASAVLSVTLALTLKSGAYIYVFWLFVYMNFAPLIMLGLISCLMPITSHSHRILKSSLQFATLFVFPLAQMAQEHAIQWFNISTHY